MMNPAAIMQAADTEAAAIPYRLDTDKVPRRACFTCNGAGHRAGVNGSAPRLCLDCLGEGSVPANRKAELALATAYVDRAVAMLERQLRGAREAVEIAETNLAFATATEGDVEAAEADVALFTDRRDAIADALSTENARLNDLFEAFAG
jgi:hypothetical protein